MPSDDDNPVSAVDGSCQVDANAGGPSSTRGTLAAMWGRNGELPLSKSDKDTSKPAPRKRRRKDEGAGAAQGRLVFSANGMSVATPPPPPAPEPVPPDSAAETGSKAAAGSDKTDVGRKGRGKRKPEGDEAKPARRRGPKKGATQPGGSKVRGPSHVSAVSSPDYLDIISDDDVEIVGGTPPTAQATGAEDDPVVVEAPKGPRKIVFAADTTRPAHGFFSRPAPAGPSTAPAAHPPEGLSSRPPSAAASGVATPTAAPNGKAPVHSFFLNGSSGAPGTLRNGWGGACKLGEEPRAPLPGGDWPNHAGASDIATSSTSSSRTTLRPRPKLTPEAADNMLWSAALGQQPQPVRHSRSAANPFSAIPVVAEHAAITAVKRDERPDDAREPWCERHRPRRAAEVLGNELEAEYLRDWLQALSVGSGGERKVVRRVPRRRLVNPDTSWIVDDIGLFGDAVDDFDGVDEDMPEPYDEPALWPGQRPNAYPPLGPFVGNTIVLTGPSGTGKSAAVHAVADELGWDIFEVYPGVGRRTATNLFSLVGEVGKNHMVGSREQKDKKPKKSSAADAARAMFAMAKAPSGSQGSAADPIELDQDGSSAPPPMEVNDDDVQLVGEGDRDASNAPSVHKQSLILIDEADILFEEESTFWPAVVSLIADSRRPVVITCNDLSAVPTDMLPLQVILHFRPPPSYSAQAYLNVIASKHALHTDVARLYAECSAPTRPDLVGSPLPPNGNEPEAHFDLRAAIAQLQLDRNSTPDRCDCTYPSDDCDLAEHEQDMATLLRRIDTLSFADAFVAPRPWEQIETEEIDHLAPEADDQLGVRLLLKPDVQDLHPALAAYSRGADMAETLTTYAGGCTPTSTHSLQRAQTTYVRSLLPLLDPLVPLSARLLPHPSLFLELLPWVRVMVTADDAFEVADRAAAAAGERRINPRTGRAVRNTAQGYERWIDLDDEALVVGRAAWGLAY